MSYETLVFSYQMNCMKSKFLCLFWLDLKIKFYTVPRSKLNTYILIMGAHRKGKRFLLRMQKPSFGEKLGF